MRHFITWLALWFFGAVGTVAQVAVPPQLIRPIQGAQLPSPLVQFEWTPSSPSAPGLVYRLTVKPRYQGQSPTQAMASNPVSLQVDVPGTSYQTSLSEANALGADAAAPNYAGHVWHVQALLNGLPYGDNQGFSQIEGFSVPAMAVDPVKPPYAGLIWELPYTALIDGGAELTYDLPANVGDTLIMIVRVRVPQKLTEDTLALLQDTSNASPSARYTGYVLNQAVASGAGRASGKTLGAVTRQAPPQGQGRGPVIPIRPSDVGLPEFRTSPGDALDYYAGGFYLYGRPGDTLVTDKEQEKRSYYAGGFYLYGGPGDTLVTDKEQETRSRYTGGYYVYGGPGDTLVTDKEQEKRSYYAGGFYLYGGPGDTLVTDKEQETRSRYTGGFFVYTIPGNGEPPTYAGYARITPSLLETRETDFYSVISKQASVRVPVPEGSTTDFVSILKPAPKDTSKVKIKTVLPPMEPYWWRQRSDTLTVPHTIFNPPDEILQGGLPLRQIAYNAGKEGAIIVERTGKAYVAGHFVPRNILLPICPIAVQESDAFPEPLSDILVAVDEESGAIEYRWLVLRRELRQIQAVVRLDCERDFYPIK